jgi:hypothetical protein
MKLDNWLAAHCGCADGTRNLPKIHALMRGATLASCHHPLATPSCRRPVHRLDLGRGNECLGGTRRCACFSRLLSLVYHPVTQWQNGTWWSMACSRLKVVGNLQICWGGGGSQSRLAPKKLRRCREAQIACNRRTYKHFIEKTMMLHVANFTDRRIPQCIWFRWKGTKDQSNSSCISLIGKNLDSPNMLWLKTHPLQSRLTNR